MKAELYEGFRICLMVFLAFMFGYFLRGDVVYSGMFKGMATMVNVEGKK